MPTASFPKTKSGAWLTPEGTPIAMRGCRFEKTEANGKKIKSEFIFFSDDSTDAKDRALLPSYHEEKDGKNLGGFVVKEGAQDVAYESVQHYVENTKKDFITLWTGLWHKYTQNDSLRDQLLKTEDKILVLDSDAKEYGQGKNFYGLILMEMRAALAEIKNNHQGPLPIDWPAGNMPAYPTNFEASFRKFEAAAKENTVDDFTRLEPLTYDEMPDRDKEAYLASFFEAEIAEALRKRAQANFYDVLEIKVATQKRMNPQSHLEEESPKIQIQGNKTSITFELTLGREKVGGGKKTSELTLERTLDPEGKTTFSITKKTDSFDELKEIFNVMAMAAAKVKTAGLERVKANGQLLTGAEEVQLNKAKFTTLEVPDRIGKVLPKQTVQVHGQDVTLEGVTQKQAAAIAAFMEHFSHVEFKIGDNKYLSLDAPRKVNNMQIVQGQPQQPFGGALPLSPLPSAPQNDDLDSDDDNANDLGIGS